MRWFGKYVTMTSHSILRKKGITIPFSDILIAVIAKEENLTILTTDRHFGQVPEIMTIAGL